MYCLALKTYSVSSYSRKASAPPFPHGSYGPDNADEFPVFREITQLENEENRLAFHNCLIKNSLITDEVSSENK